MFETFRRKFVGFALCGAAMCALSAPAFANADRAAQLGLDASALKLELTGLQSAAETANVLDAVQLDDALSHRLQLFGASASRLSIDAEAHGVADDFACIFRGMAEETDVQMRALKSADASGDQKTPIARLVKMMDDAEIVGAAAAHAFARDGSKSLSDRSAKTCPANPAQTQYLTLQP
ncbi:MAG: hypothetical protein AAF719_02385 [Pseudomonadota bacterium]